MRLLAPHDVRPYVRRNKTDRTDAKGLLEANRNEEIHAVPVKSVSHQAIASLHCRRSTWLSTRTARLNTLQGLLREFGVFIQVGAHHVVPRVRALLADATGLPLLLQAMLTAACDEIDRLEANKSPWRDAGLGRDVGEGEFVRSTSCHSALDGTEDLVVSDLLPALAHRVDRT